MEYWFNLHLKYGAVLDSSYSKKVELVCIFYLQEQGMSQICNFLINHPVEYKQKAVPIIIGPRKLQNLAIIHLNAPNPA